MTMRRRRSSLPKRHEWDKIFKQYVRGNPLVVFAFLLAMTGPTLSVMRRKVWGVIFYDPQSSGDILGPLAASLWGADDHVRLPSHLGSRAHDLEQYLWQHADGFLTLGRDQLRGPPRQAGEMLHKLATYAAEGFSEGDRNRSGPFVVIGETNCFPDTLLRAAGLERDPRLVVIPAGVAAGLAPGHGPFHHLDDFQNGWYLSDHLQRLLSPISDTVFSEYLIHLARENVEDPTGLASRFQDCIDDYEQNLSEITVDPVDEHLFSSFPTVYAVAKSIVHWGILDITDKEMLNIVNFCENLCFDLYSDSKVMGDLIMPVVQYITNNFDYFLEIPQEGLDDAALRKAPGFYKTDIEGRIIEIQIEPTRFRKEMARFGVTRILQACDDAGYLIRDRRSFEKKSQIRPGEDVRKYMYRFDVSILDYQVK